MTPESLIAEYGMTAFDRAFAYLVDAEGGISTDRQDAGNWTGGAVGKGEFRGSKFGISASRYPLLNIDALTLDAAKGLYFRDYWTAGNCDELPAELAFAFMDACVNHGVTGATKILQRTLGVTEDGIVGQHTIKAAHALPALDAVIEFQAERIVAYANLGTWHLYGRGWARRDIRTAIAALQ